MTDATPGRPERGDVPQSVPPDAGEVPPPVTPPPPAAAEPTYRAPDVGTTGSARSSDDIRRDIEGTRAELGETITEIEDRVSPGKIRERQTQRMRSRWQRVREQVMGTRDDVRDRARSVGGDLRERVGGSGDGSSMTDTAQERADEAREQVQGNPLAAGLIAFGGGLLASSLVPSTRREQDAVEQLRDVAEQPVKEQLQEAGHRLQEDAREKVGERVKDVGKEAMGAAARAGSEAQDSATRVKEETQQSANEVRQQQ